MVLKLGGAAWCRSIVMLLSRYLVGGEASASRNWASLYFQRLRPWCATRCGPVLGRGLNHLGEGSCKPGTRATIRSLIYRRVYRESCIMEERPGGQAR